jgi:hypothetical protein
MHARILTICAVTAFIIAKMMRSVSVADGSTRLRLRHTLQDPKSRLTTRLEGCRLHIVFMVLKPPRIDEVCPRKKSVALCNQKRLYLQEMCACVFVFLRGLSLCLSIIDACCQAANSVCSENVYVL